MKERKELKDFIEVILITDKTLDEEIDNMWKDGGEIENLIFPESMFEDLD